MTLKELKNITEWDSKLGLYKVLTKEKIYKSKKEEDIEEMIIMIRELGVKIKVAKSIVKLRPKLWFSVIDRD